MNTDEHHLSLVFGCIYLTAGWNDTHTWLHIDDAHPSSSEHLINGIGAGPIQVTFIHPVLHKPENTGKHGTQLYTHIKKAAAV